MQLPGSTGSCFSCLHSPGLCELTGEGKRYGFSKTMSDSWLKSWIYCSFLLYFFCVVLGVMASPRWCCLGVSLPLLLLLLLRWPGLLAVAEQVALVEVFLEQRPDASDLLQGEVVESSLGGGSSEQRDEEREELEADLVLVSGPGGVKATRRAGNTSPRETTRGHKSCFLIRTETRI